MATTVLLGSGSAALRAEPVDPGRLFYTPSQRDQLEAARARAPRRAASNPPGAAGEDPPPLRYDGVVIRSDGKSIRWVNGKPQVDGAGVSGLRPGQIRADGKVYEPYEVLRPLDSSPGLPGERKSAP